MKNQWPFWLFVIAILVVVVIALNYQAKPDPVPFGDIFSDQPVAFEYEYVTPPGGQAADASVAPVSAVEAERAAVAKAPAQPAADVVPFTEPAPALVPGSYAVQILSSKDEKATEAELAKVKTNGFPEAYIRRADLGARGIWHRIYVGQYSTMQQAQEGLDRVKQKYPQAFIFKF